MHHGEKQTCRRHPGEREEERDTGIKGLSQSKHGRKGTPKNSLEVREGDAPRESYAVVKRRGEKVEGRGINKRKTGVRRKESREGRWRVKTSTEKNQNDSLRSANSGFKI